VFETTTRLATERLRGPGDARKPFVPSSVRPAPASPRPVHAADFDVEPRDSPSVPLTPSPLRPMRTGRARPGGPGTLDRGVLGAALDPRLARVPEPFVDPVVGEKLG
jgi:hypothetical protein